MNLTKILITLLIVFATFFSASGQVKKGNILVTPTLGIPYLDLFGHDADVFDISSGGMNMYYRGFNGEENLKIKLRGVYGIKVDYLLMDKIGLGLDFMYNSAEVTFNRDSIIGNEILKDVNFQEKMTRYRIALRFNFHFYSTEKVNVYTGVNLGIRKRVFTYEADDKDYEPIFEEQFGFGVSSVGSDFLPITIPSGSDLPVHAKIAIGLHYFPNSIIGFNFEASIGGPPIIVGLTIKL